jgi:type IV pilus assembly protein PilE
VTMAMPIKRQRSTLRHWPRNRGFTMAEVLVVVAIVAILASIAYPSYTDQIRKSRRSDAKNALMDAANRLEQFILDRGTYTITMTNLGYAADPAISEDGFYSFDAVAGACGAIQSCFTLTATARGVQTQDLDCKFFIFQSTGARSATTSGGAVNAECW